MKAAAFVILVTVSLLFAQGGGGLPGPIRRLQNDEPVIPPTLEQAITAAGKAAREAALPPIDTKT